MNPHELEEHLSHEEAARTALHGQQVAFIGAGVMAEVMIAGLLERQLIAPEAIRASHPRPRRVEELTERFASSGRLPTGKRRRGRTS